ncbi:replication-relaxation family protein [Fictibacillus barbaricus]|uniref:Uncharacterized protein n=1 Tax=Fictibacillus barbaricus TaxID=182136 RepID=A0ABU1U431_9BACL|nr:replication-relaxation family protein [Fictibacillus barbaricus]MDR7074195.1 hypothetical protein [Fictibacillus barbaricus]
MILTSGSIVIKRDHNRKKLTLRYYDLKLFNNLLTEKLLTEKQLYRYYTTIHGKRISYPGFWKKLAKFEEYGLIKSYKYKVGQNGTTLKYFRLRQYGYDLIKNIKVVPKYYENEKLSNIPKTNLDHHFGTKEVILNSLIEFKDPNPILEEPQIIPSRIARVFPAVIPDGVIKLGEATLYIEFDSGSEALNELKGKVLRYLAEADHYTEEERKEGILIALLDNSIPNRKGIEDRTNRIRNITKVISTLPEVLNKNIHIYVLPMFLASKGALSFLEEDKDYTIRRDLCKILDLLKRGNCHNSIEIIEGMDILTSYNKNYNFSPQLINIHEKNQNTIFFTIFQYKEIGNIIDYDKIVQLSDVRCLEPGCTAEFLYVVYEDEETMRMDIKITGALKKVRYITVKTTHDFVERPYIFMRDTKNTVKKVYDQKQWPNLLF